MIVYWGRRNGKNRIGNWDKTLIQYWTDAMLMAVVEVGLIVNE